VTSCRTPGNNVLGYSVVVVTGMGSRVAAVPFIADGPAFRNELNNMLFATEERTVGNAAALQGC
jgi:hypothetical protein